MKVYLLCFILETVYRFGIHRIFILHYAFYFRSSNIPLAMLRRVFNLSFIDALGVILDGPLWKTRSRMSQIRFEFKLQNKKGNPNERVWVLESVSWQYLDFDLQLLLLKIYIWEVAFSIFLLASVAALTVIFDDLHNALSGFIYEFL